MLPFTAPNAPCCRAKYFRLRLPNTRNTAVTHPSITREARNSSGDRDTIMATTPTKVMALERSDTTDCSRAICTLSASLVKRLMSSPWVWASK